MNKEEIENNRIPKEIAKALGIEKEDKDSLIAFKENLYEQTVRENVRLKKELEQKESILDKVTDKLKEDIPEAKEKIKYWEEQYRMSKAKKDEFYKNSYKRQVNKWHSRFETLRGILNIIEGEKE